MEKLDNIEKINHYENYRNELDNIIKNVCVDNILDEQERGRFIGFLNSARYHCQGKINKLGNAEITTKVNYNENANYNKSL